MKIGETIGETIAVGKYYSYFTQIVDSMPIDRQPVQKAEPGGTAGLKIRECVRPGDQVLKVISA